MGPDQVTWFGRLETENDNFRAVLSWSLDGEGEPRGARSWGCDSTVALWLFWNIQGRSEGRQWVRGGASEDAREDCRQGEGTQRGRLDVALGRRLR